MLLQRLPGEPAQVRAGAERVSETAGLVLQCAETLSRLVDGDAGTSKGLDTAVDRGRVVTPRLREAARRYEVAGAALVDFAADQAEAIEAAELAILRYEQASDDLWTLLATDVGEERDAAHEEALDDARDEKAAALDAYRRARRDFDDAGDRADRLIEDVVKDSPLNDSRWDDVQGFGEDVLGGLSGLCDIVADVLAALAGLAIVLVDRQWPFEGDPYEVPEEVQDAAHVRFNNDRAYRDHVIEVFDLARGSYRDTGAPDGWERLSEGALRAHDVRMTDEDGFSAAVYRNEETGGIVVAYRGTEPGTLGDDSQDLVNAGGLASSQGDQAIALATDVVGAFGGGTVEFTGHSLGGSLAATASVATGAPATTFNAAGVGEGNWGNAAAAHGPGADAHEVTNFSTPNDPLTLFQESQSVTPAAGSQITVASSSTMPWQGHGMGEFDWAPYR